VKENPKLLATVARPEHACKHFRKESVATGWRLFFVEGIKTTGRVSIDILETKKDISQATHSSPDSREVSIDILETKKKKISQLTT
jgi:hypothetical protein